MNTDTDHESFNNPGHFKNLTNKQNMKMFPSHFNPSFHAFHIDKICREEINPNDTFRGKKNHHSP